MKTDSISERSAAAEQSSRRNVPWLVIAALLVVAAALGWLAAFGFPREWGDVLFFKQPAYMALHTGRFTLPTAIGYRPYVDVVYAAYPPLYAYASLAVFKLFGFGVHASLGFDVAVHLLLAGLLGWILGGRRAARPRPRCSSCSPPASCSPRDGLTSWPRCSRCWRSWRPSGAATLSRPCCWV